MAEQALVAYRGGGLPNQDINTCKRSPHLQERYAKIIESEFEPEAKNTCKCVQCFPNVQPL